MRGAAARRGARRTATSARSRSSCATARASAAGRARCNDAADRARALAAVLSRNAYHHQTPPMPRRSARPHSSILVVAARWGGRRLRVRPRARTRDRRGHQGQRRRRRRPDAAQARAKLRAALLEPLEPARRRPLRGPHLHAHAEQARRSPSTSTARSTARWPPRATGNIFTRTWREVRGDRARRRPRRQGHLLAEAVDRTPRRGACSSELTIEPRDASVDLEPAASTRVTSSDGLRRARRPPAARHRARAARLGRHAGSRACARASSSPRSPPRSSPRSIRRSSSSTAAPSS